MYIHLQPSNKIKLAIEVCPQKKLKIKNVNEKCDRITWYGRMMEFNYY